VAQVIWGWMLFLSAICYNYYYSYCFTAFYLGLPGWAGTRRNIHPLTLIV